ncbi:MAG: hypothetical protein Q9163_006407, partial [Psora crenata]
EIDTSYFVLTVDLWSADGLREVNLVRHSATSPSISAATATSYPPTHDPALAFAPQPVLTHSFYPGYDPAQPWGQPPYPLPRQNELSRHMQAAQQAQREDAMRIQHEQQQLQNQGLHHPLPQPGVGPKMHPSTQTFFNSSAGIASTMNGFYPPSSAGAQGPLESSNPPPASLSVVDPRSQPGGMFTRNLIGNLAVGAFKLTYPENDLGVWFILQDLSVRTEGVFRLKLNFVDVGASSASAPMSQASAPGTPGNGPSTHPNTPALSSRPSVPSTLQTGILNASSAPVLATAYSNEFQVFSAKKFPGVIDSTELSKAFAKQGIKIPIRKDGGGRGNERRDWEGDE